MYFAALKYFNFNMKKLLFFLGILLVFLGSCNKDRPKPSWDVDMLMPLFNDTITITDFISDTLLAENPDSSLTFIFDQKLYEVNGDSVVTIPDTVFYWEFSFFVPITVDPGQVILDEHFDQLLDFDFGIELENAIMHSGEISFEMENQSDGNMLSDFTINSAISPEGDTFALYNQFIPKNELYNSVSDFSGYKLDFTGEDGGVYNTFNFNLKFWVDPNEPEPIQFTQADTFKFYVHFTNVVLDYAKGNFGKTDFQFGPETTEFNMFEDMEIAGFSIGDAYVNLRIDNYYGVDGLLKLLDVNAKNTTTGESVSLQGDIMDSTLYVDRAYQTGPGIDGIHPSKNYFDFSNTNIFDLLEIMPNEFTYFVGIQTNPTGDTLDHSHFFYLDTPMQVFMEAEVNGGIGIEDLVIRKENDWNGANANFDRIGDGLLKLKFTNGFPFSFDIDMFLDDEDGNVIDTLLYNANIETAIPESDGRVIEPEISYIEIALNDELKQSVADAKKARYVMHINSAMNEQVKLYSDHTMELKVIGDFKMKLEQ